MSALRGERFFKLLQKYNIFKYILGFNIVGDGTPQAYIPFLTGQTEVELPLTRKRYANARFVDQVYPFAWRNFSDAGYATLYGEDSHVIGKRSYCVCFGKSIKFVVELICKKLTRNEIFRYFYISSERFSQTADGSLYPDVLPGVGVEMWWKLSVHRWNLSARGKIYFYYCVIFV